MLRSIIYLIPDLRMEGRWSLAPYRIALFPIEGWRFRRSLTFHIQPVTCKDVANNPQILRTQEQTRNSCNIVLRTFPLVPYIYCQYDPQGTWWMWSVEIKTRNLHISSFASASIRYKLSNWAMHGVTSTMFGRAIAKKTEVQPRGKGRSFESELLEFFRHLSCKLMLARHLRLIPNQLQHWDKYRWFNCHQSIDIHTYINSHSDILIFQWSCGHFCSQHFHPKSSVSKN